MISINREQMEDTSLGIAIIDSEGVVLYTNELLRHSFRGQMTGKKCWSAFWNREEPCEGCLAGKKSVLLESPRGVNAKNAPEKGFVQVNKVSINYRGKPAVMELFHDVASGKEEAVQKRIEEEKLDAIRTLSATYSHHVRNAIAPISGYAELLLKNENLTAEQRKRLEIIIKNVSIVVELVNKAEKINSYSLTHFGGFDLFDLAEKNSQSE